MKTTKHRLILPMQAKGNMGKSIEAAARASWLNQRGIQWQGFDLDGDNRTLSRLFPDQVKLTPLNGQAEDLDELISILRKTTAKPVTVVDPRAHLDAQLMKALGATHFFDIASAQNIGITLMVFPLDDLDVMSNLDAVCQFCGKQVDYVIVHNPARAPKTRMFAGSELEKELLNQGAVTITVPVLSEFVKLRLAKLEADQQRGIPFNEAIGNDTLGLDIMARGVLQDWLATMFNQYDRIAANPKWLIYLPPTMSPCETSHAPGLLEHPAEAFAYFRHAGVPRVVCEEKHMGSRAVVIVCRDEDAARKSFGVTGEGIGICYTRTGRRFFDDAKLEREFLTHVQTAATSAGFWDEFKTGWLCLDCELMPWSAKAQELLKKQYAAVGASARASLAEEVAVLEQAAAHDLDVGELLARTISRRQMVGDYIEAYRRYCWPVNSVNDLKLAPFHLLATEGAVHTDKPHTWHMETLARLAGGIIVATPFHVIDLTDSNSEAEGIRWWEELTGRGGEGMVVKPLDFIVRGRRGLVQPAVKCRGREYLRIIYGPEYTAAENLERLRARGLSTKRSLALREFALGIESLERFARKEPLRRVHEAVFGVLAMESEPVDPRL